MRSISSVVIPGLMAACASSRMVRAMWHALRVPSICFAVLMGTALPHASQSRTESFNRHSHAARVAAQAEHGGRTWKHRGGASQWLGSPPPRDNHNDPAGVWARSEAGQSLASHMPAGDATVQGRGDQI